MVLLTVIYTISEKQEKQRKNRDGVKVYTTDVVIEEQEFAESKAAGGASTSNNSYQASPAPSPSVDIGDGFMNIPDGIDEELPFS